MPLGMEVGLGPRVVVLDGDPAPPTQRGQQPSPFFPAHPYCAQTVGWIGMPLGVEVALFQSNIVLDGDLAPPHK